jgi:hypothetical protein
MAALPLKAAAVNFVTAMAGFPTIAATIGLFDSDRIDVRSMG